MIDRAGNFWPVFPGVISDCLLLGGGSYPCAPKAPILDPIISSIKLLYAQVCDDGHMSSVDVPKRLLVATGDDWALWWPRAEWQALTPEERRHIIRRQRQMLDKAKKEATANGETSD